MVERHLQHELALALAGEALAEEPDAVFGYTPLRL